MRPGCLSVGLEIGEDPFGLGGARPAERRAVKVVLESMGVPFPEGASAVLDSASATLEVRNTAENLELVAALIETSRTEGPKSLRVRVEVYAIESPLALQISRCAGVAVGARGGLQAVREAMAAGTADVGSVLREMPRPE